MSNFLKILADHLVKKYHGEFEGFCFLFPNRRSQLFFKNYLKDMLEEPGWLPEMMDISEFMTVLSGLEPADPVELSFEVYASYRRFFENPESFDEFFPWGEMMISDFDDLDKYLIDPGQLFTNILQLKEIDTVFDFLSVEQKQIILNFWKYFEQGKLSEHKESFLKIWKILFPVYTDLKEKLEAKGIAYEGMIYREVAENITEGRKEIKWKRVIITGFNALSRSEMAVFDYLKNSGNTEFYWDYDRIYVDEEESEAGRFIRENIKRYPQDPSFDPGFEGLKKKKNFSVYNLPSDILQAKQLFSELAERKDKDLNALNNTAVILGDESLLTSVLSSLPDNIRNLNITMGFPVTQTPVYSFIDNILKLQQNYARRKSREYYFRDVLAILNHQYLQSFYHRATFEVVNEIHRLNRIYIPPEFFEKDPVLGRIFQKVDNAHSMMLYLSELLDTLMSEMPEKHNDPRLELEYIYIIRTRLIKLFNLFIENPLIETLDSFIRLFRKILSSYNIPFSGEPLQGLQLMGILESRLLDFENVYVLSLNEGIMPAVSRTLSFVPANMRYAFGMPVREDRDAIYAYYFFRLLQRAGNVTLMYNSKTEGMLSGEPSRYIYQLQYLQDQEISFRTKAFEITPERGKEIRIIKNDAVKRVLDGFRDPEGEKYLSPSAITAYMDCSLRFYFSYLAGIREEDEATEEIDAPLFGTLYHKGMELVYEDFEGKVISRDDFERILTDINIRQKLDEAFRSVFFKTLDPAAEVKPEGRNIIVYEIIFRIIKKTLEVDSQSAPFELVSRELLIDLFSPGFHGAGQVHLGGKIDRIDRREGKLYLIDYKTGKVSLEFQDIRDVANRESWGSNQYLKGVFQTFMYSWLYTEKHRGSGPIVPGIYSVNGLFSDRFDILLTDKSRSASVTSYSEYHNEFQEGLERIIAEIFDTSVDFTQTEDEKRCVNCLYRNICHR